MEKLLLRHWFSENNFMNYYIVQTIVKIHKNFLRFKVFTKQYLFYHFVYFIACPWYFCISWIDTFIQQSLVFRVLSSPEAEKVAKDGGYVLSEFYQKMLFIHTENKNNSCLINTLWRVDLKKFPQPKKDYDQQIESKTKQKERLCFLIKKVLDKNLNLFWIWKNYRYLNSFFVAKH